MAVSRMDYLGKLFREENREAVQRYVEGRDLPGPLLIEFDPTTTCNYSCPECISRDLLNRSQISPERVSRLLREFQAAGVQGIIFIGGGEPLAHSSMPEPIVEANRLGMAVGLTTNGSLIGRHLDALAENVAWTRVSMDAGTPETYRRFRPSKIKDAFERVVQNMRDLAAVKKGQLGYSFLVMQRPDTGSTNAGEIASAAALAKSIGCDYFEFKPMVDNRHYLLPMSPSMRTVIEEQMRECRKLVDATFEVIVPESINHLLRLDDPIQPKRYTACPATELRTLVTPSGIYPCPYHRGREDKRLGSVDDAPFHEFWPSAARRAAAARIDPSRDCEFYCIRHRTNITLSALRDLHAEGVPLLDHIAADATPDPFF